MLTIRSRSSLIAFLLLMSACAGASPQKEPSAITPAYVTPEFTEAGIVILALGDIGHLSDLSREDSVDNSLFEDEQGLQPGEAKSALLKTQLKIAELAAQYGEVRLLVASSESKIWLLEHCETFRGQLCDFIGQGLIRIEIVPHAGPWVRDFGPVFGKDAAGHPLVISAHYHDRRAEEARDDELSKIHAMRLLLAKRLLAALRERELKVFESKFADLFSQDDASPASTRESQRRGGEFDPAEDRDHDAIPGRQAALSADQAQAGQIMQPGDATAQLAGDSMAPVASPDPTVPSADDANALALLPPPPPPPPGADQEPSPLQASIETLARESVRKERSENDEVRVLKQELDTYSQAADAMRRQDVNRTVDERSPYGIAVDLAENADFQAVRVDLDLDGGNLLRAEDGHCFTTKGLLVRNPEHNPTVTRLLEESYGCKGVTYLEALPGPGVIEHVDMFLLPGKGKTLFLASYDPTNKLLAQHWSDADRMERRLAEEAAVSMHINEGTLAKSGYHVVLVPSPLPRHESAGSFYYPTVLNDLVLLDKSGHYHAIMPAYERYQVDVQDAAISALRSNFGADITVDQVEATQAGKGQGAVHCLTLLAPFSVVGSANADIADYRRRISIASVEAAKPRSSEQMASRLQGTWRDPGTGVPTVLVLFESDRVHLHSESEKQDFAYRLAQHDGRWKIELDMDGTMTPVGLQWISDDQIQFGSQNLRRMR